MVAVTGVGWSHIMPVRLGADGSGIRRQYMPVCLLLKMVVLPGITGVVELRLSGSYAQYCSGGVVPVPGWGRAGSVLLSTRTYLLSGVRMLMLSLTGSGGAARMEAVVEWQSVVMHAAAAKQSWRHVVLELHSQPCFQTVQMAQCVFMCVMLCLSMFVTTVS
jgi:hypothetical protein